MKERILDCMNDLFQKNTKCNYVFLLNGKDICFGELYTVDAYLKAYELALKGCDVYCYMAPLGIKAAAPIFKIEDGVIILSGIEIGRIKKNAIINIEKLKQIIKIIVNNHSRHEITYTFIG